MAARSEGVDYFALGGLVDYLHSLCLSLKRDYHRFVLASFPGSPRMRMKNQKERGEPGKIYHMRNVIGRKNLITCG